MVKMNLGQIPGISPISVALSLNLGVFIHKMGTQPAQEACRKD